MLNILHYYGNPFTKGKGIKNFKHVLCITHKARVNFRLFIKNPLYESIHNYSSIIDKTVTPQTLFLPHKFKNNSKISENISTVKPNNINFIYKGGQQNNTININMGNINFPSNNLKLDNKSELKILNSTDISNNKIVFKIEMEISKPNEVLNLNSSS